MQKIILFCFAFLFIYLFVYVFLFILFDWSIFIYLIDQFFFLDSL